MGNEIEKKEIRGKRNRKDRNRKEFELDLTMPSTLASSYI